MKKCGVGVILSWIPSCHALSPFGTAFRHSTYKTTPTFLHSNREPALLAKANEDADIEDEFDFTPQFDGMMYYGIPSDSEGKVTTSLEEIRQKVGISETEEFIQEEQEDVFITNDGRKKRKFQNFPIISRTVPLGIRNDKDEGLSATVWELTKPSVLVENWMESLDSADSSPPDPFGVVMWPGSIVASREMQRLDVAHKTVLILGAGLGVEAQAAAALGASRVIATDVNPLSLDLLKLGAKESGWDSVIETRVFDVESDEPLPQADVVVAADVLYNKELAIEIGKRCYEVLSINTDKVHRPSLIVTDSQRFHGTDFLTELNSKLEAASANGKEMQTTSSVSNVQWDERMLEDVITSGIMIDEDQTYDIKVRSISIQGTL